MKTSKFFLGANSDTGFKSYFEQLQAKETGLQLLILKGGAGSGKSSLMKRVLSFAKERGHEVEIIPCASDPYSLDAVIDHTQGFAIMDGTAPHVTDPVLAGVSSHIIYTGDLWDVKKLQSKKAEIEPLAEKISDCHKSATAYIKSVSSLLCENMSYAEKFIDKDKASSFARRLTNEVLCEANGKVTKRLLSAVSVDELVVFEKTPFILSDKVYVLCDKWGAVANYILGKIYLAAREQKQEVIYCPCSVISGKCDHLIFPRSRISIVTQNRFHSFSDGEKIDLGGFYENLPLSAHLEKRLSVAEKIIPLAASCVGEAKALHDILEKYYVEAMDFSGMDSLFSKILSTFYSQNM